MASTYTQLLFHVVFSTKNRQPLITPQIREELYPYIGGIVRDQRGLVIEVGGVADHVHIAVRLPTDLSVADALRLVKANSSKWVGERFGIEFAWQVGYSAFTVSKSVLPSVCAYIQGQEEHHRKRSFQEELVELLERHGVEYDERYLLD